MADGDFDSHEYDFDDDFAPLERVPSLRPRARSDEYLRYARRCLTIETMSSCSGPDPLPFDPEYYENAENLPEIEESPSLPPIKTRHSSLGKRRSNSLSLDPIPEQEYEQEESVGLYISRPPSRGPKIKPKLTIPATIGSTSPVEEEGCPGTISRPRSSSSWDMSTIDPIPEQGMESSGLHIQRPLSQRPKSGLMHGIPTVIGSAYRDEDAISPKTIPEHRSPWNTNISPIKVDVEEVSDRVPDNMHSRETSYSRPSLTEHTISSKTSTSDFAMTGGNSFVSGSTAPTTPGYGYFSTSPFADSHAHPAKGKKTMTVQLSLSQPEVSESDLTSELVKSTTAFNALNIHHRYVPGAQNVHDLVGFDVRERQSAISFNVPNYRQEQIRTGGHSGSTTVPPLKRNIYSSPSCVKPTNLPAGPPGHLEVEVMHGKLLHAGSIISLTDEEQKHQVDTESSRRERSLPPRIKPAILHTTRRLSDGALPLVWTRPHRSRSFPSWTPHKAIDPREQLHIWRHQKGPHHINRALKRKPLGESKQNHGKRFGDLASYIAVSMFRTSTKETFPLKRTNPKTSVALQKSTPCDVPLQRPWDVLQELVRKPSKAQPNQQDYFGTADLHPNKMIWNRLPKDIQISNETLRLRYATAVSTVNHFVQFRLRTIEMLKTQWMNDKQWEIHCRYWEAAKQSAINNIIHAVKAYIRFEKIFDLGMQGELAPFFRKTSLQSRAAVKQCIWVALDALFYLRNVFCKQYQHAHWLFSKYGTEPEEVVEKFKIDLDEDPYDESGWADIVWTG